MIINTDDLKKKIIYRSSYRGTKEMDKLLSLFTKKIINNLNESELIDLSNLLDIDDDNLYKLNQGMNIAIKIKMSRVAMLFKNFKYNEN